MSGSSSLLSINSSGPSAPDYHAINGNAQQQEGNQQELPPPPYDSISRQIARRPRVIKAAQAVNNNLLENISLPLMLGFAGYLWNALLEARQALQDCDPSNPHVYKDNWIQTLLIAANFIFVGIHLFRAGYNVFEALNNCEDALINNNVMTLEQMKAQDSSRPHRAAKYLGLTASASVMSAAVLFSQGQFESGIAATWFSLAAFLFRSYLKGKECENAYKTITESDYASIMSNAQKRSLQIGGLIAVAGGIGLAVVDHLVTKELKVGGTNPHQLSALAAQAVMVAGFAIAGNYFGLRGSDAFEAAVEHKAPGGVHFNHATLFGRNVRRDLKNIGLATIDTILAAALAVGFTIKPADGLQLLPLLIGSSGLAFAANTSANAYAIDLNKVTARLKDSNKRIAEIVDENGGCIDRIVGFCRPGRRN